MDLRAARIVLGLVVGASSMYCGFGCARPQRAVVRANGEHAALSTDAPITIRSFTPPAIHLDNDGKTTDPTQVVYEIRTANDEELTDGRLEMLNCGKSAVSLPIAELTPGIHQITVPAGVQLSLPVDQILVFVKSPDGTYSTNIEQVLPAQAGKNAEVARTPPLIRPAPGTGAPDGSTDDEAGISIANPAEALPAGDVALTGVDTTFTRYEYEAPNAETITVKLDGVDLRKGMPVGFQVMAGSHIREIVTAPIESVAVLPNPDGVAANENGNVNVEGTVIVPRRIEGYCIARTVITARMKSLATVVTAVKVIGGDQTTF